MAFRGATEVMLSAHMKFNQAPTRNTSPTQLWLCLGILTLAFAGFFGGIGFVMGHREASNAWGVLIVGSLIVFYIFLGLLAFMLRRSVTMWLLLTMFTSPIGPVVAYFMIFRDTLAEGRYQAASRTGPKTDMRQI